MCDRGFGVRLSLALTVADREQITHGPEGVRRHLAPFCGAKSRAGRTWMPAPTIESGFGGSARRTRIGSFRTGDRAVDHIGLLRSFYGSSEVHISERIASLAQLAEQLTLNQ